MKYIELVKGLFTADHETRAKQADPYVSYSIEANKLMLNLTPEPIVSGPWVTFTAEEDNSSIGLNKLSTNQMLEYSTDTSAWNTMDTTTNISLNNGDKVYVRGMLSADNTTSNYTTFKMTGKIAASGNCNALWNYQDLNAPLKAYCGYQMFSYCSSLTATPELPATELAERCYNYMFSGCTSLTTAPELFATTLAKCCYEYMFNGCSSLTTPSKLPATELTEQCYRYMFSKCTSLTTTPELPATTLAPYCYDGMFISCTSLTTTPTILPAALLVERCYYSMFEGCTSLTTTPELPATTLAPYCCSRMFFTCIALTTAPEVLLATTLAEGCYYHMFAGCTSLTTAPELPAATLTTCCYYRMFEGCTNLTRIKCLATNISANDCTSRWVYRVSSTGTFIKHPNTTSWKTGAFGIPSGWTVEDAVL